MSRILFTWEFGRNLGHLSRDLPLVRACLAAGHEVVSCVPDLVSAAAVLSDPRVRLLPSPSMRRGGWRSRPPFDFADLLLHEGYEQAEVAAAALRSWRDLYTLLRPDAIVYNHAPTALLAARQLGLPVLVQGTGFELPPDGHPLPSIRPWEAVDAARQGEAAARVLAFANAQLRAFDRAELVHLGELFGPSRLLTTFSELDPFPGRAGARYIGPVFALPTSVPLQWGGGDRARVLAYLRPGIPGCEAMLAALESPGADVVCAVPDLPAAWPARYPRLRLFAQAVDIAALLPRASLVITAGAGTIATALLAGVPVLVMPQFVEQYLAGLTLARTGAGLTLRDRRTPALCAAMLRQLLDGAGYRAAARDFARCHASFSVESAVAVQVQALDALLGAAA